jgi:hypothetical protein
VVNHYRNAGQKAFAQSQLGWKWKIFLRAKRLKAAGQLLPTDKKELRRLAGTLGPR